MADSPPPDPFALLARRAATGDVKATKALLLHLGPHVFGVLRVLLGKNDADVDDVAQEAMVALARALPAFRFESSVVHFARCVTLRQAQLALRHRRAQRRAVGVTELRDDLDETVAREGSSPLGDAIVAERMRALRAMVAELPAEQAEALALRVVLGCSVEEIAALTKAPVNTVRSRLRTAKSALRERVGADDGEEES